MHHHPETDTLIAPDWIDRTLAFLKKRPIVWIPLLVIIVGAGIYGFNQIYTTTPVGTDPTIAGKPLSNPDQHLHTLAIDPSRPGIIYLGSHYGLFTSMDDGKTWPEKRGALNQVMITSIAVHEKSPGTIALIGLQPSGGDFGLNGIYLTHDQGKTWGRISDPPGIPADVSRYSILSVPDSPTDWIVIYVGKGVYRTQDDGKTWTLLKAPESDQDAQRSVYVDPANAQHLLIGSSLGLWQSQDGGTTWNKASAIPSGVDVILPSRHDPTRLYFSADDGMYRSDDSGQTIVRTSGTVAQSAFSRMASSYQRTDVVYGLTGNEVWQSTDGGVNWSQQSVLQTTNPMALLVAPDNDQHLYVGFYAPALAATSRDSGHTWQSIT